MKKIFRKNTIFEKLCLDFSLCRGITNMQVGCKIIKQIIKSMTNSDKSYFISTFWHINFDKKCGEKIYSNNTYSGQNIKSISLNHVANSDNIRNDKKDWLVRINLENMQVRRNINHPQYKKLSSKIELFLTDISFYF